MNRSVPISEQDALLDKLDRVHWDDLHLFRTVATSASFRKAAAKLSLSVNTIRSRVERLESSLGTTLLNRSPDGIRLSEDGQAILDVTLEMQSFSTQLRMGAGNNLLVQPGEVRICCTEGIGTFWLTPLLQELNEILPDHNIVFYNEYNQNVIHSRHFDICIGYSRPTNPEAMVTKIGTLHQMSFASRDYINKNGNIDSINQLTCHKIIMQEAPGISYESAKLFIGEDLFRKIVIEKYNTGYSFLWAVSNGRGIAVLPSYVRSLTDNIIPLALPMHFKFDIWLSFQRTSRDSKPIRAVINWLQRCFDPVRYPWFAENFMHPDEFEEISAEVRVARQPFAV